MNPSHSLDNAASSMLSSTVSAAAEFFGSGRVTVSLHGTQGPVPRNLFTYGLRSLNVASKRGLALVVGMAVGGALLAAGMSSAHGKDLPPEPTSAVPMMKDVGSGIPLVPLPAFAGTVTVTAQRPAQPSPGAHVTGVSVTSSGGSFFGAPAARTCEIHVDGTVSGFMERLTQAGVSSKAVVSFLSAHAAAQCAGGPEMERAVVPILRTGKDPHSIVTGTVGLEIMEGAVDDAIAMMTESYADVYGVLSALQQHPDAGENLLVAVHDVRLAGAVSTMPGSRLPGFMAPYSVNRSMAALGALHSEIKEGRLTVSDIASRTPEQLHELARTLALKSWKLSGAQNEAAIASNPAAGRALDSATHFGSMKFLGTGKLATETMGPDQLRVHAEYGEAVARNQRSAESMQIRAQQIQRARASSQFSAQGSGAVKVAQAETGNPAAGWFKMK
jgi:hypothetical protein